ncbi:subtilase-type protease inhibitor [Streptomyces scopuliridis]|uniref:Subtilase-type protease inhibitor n=1 Tax=Streptomyces scopuliridis TaxID=452529 RepID=A0ACD4ZLS7_9ACTN|nr:SSI family serine proteinase inhibitor [Streptomyces scopuliridis]WSB99163.1 subtilase-type protease inhibitor [Streptomyces scopuliridis]WSC07135.1 subtilase-type protease inhibitor [Streptomyces scopuliridis]
MLRRLVLTAAASVAASATLLGAVAPAASADASARADTGAFTESAGGTLTRLAPVPLPPAEDADEFTVTVADSGLRGADGTYRLKCRPAGGTHQQARAACDRLAQLASEKKDPFAPVAKGTQCTMLYGGDATARITGTWQGHAVDATFNRKNGCEIARWQTLEPVLPSTRA